MRVLVMTIALGASACDGFTLPPLLPCADCCGTRIGGYTSHLWRVAPDLSLDEKISFHRDDFTLNSVAFGDVDGDGSEDAVFAAAGFAGLALVRDVGGGDGNVELSPDLLDALDPPQLALVDMDGDGDLDVLAARHEGSAAVLLENDGLGQFRSLGELFADAPRLLIVELDGAPPTEIFGSSGTGPLELLQGTASGALDVPGATLLMPVAVDVDEDGDLDLVGVGWQDDARVVVARLNDGAGALTALVLPLDVDRDATVTLRAGQRELVVQEGPSFAAIALGTTALGPRRALGQLPDGSTCVSGGCPVLLLDLTGDGSRDALLSTVQEELVALEESGVRRSVGRAGELLLAGDTPWLLDAPMRCAGEGF
ncbi:MAG: VCBS repeat-containing protein [Deltaproteobacteria bacterium]|nr:VCBS repeat-containing protein [Deltaproteobacteria bacterium]